MPGFESDLATYSLWGSCGSLSLSVPQSPHLWMKGAPAPSGGGAVRTQRVSISQMLRTGPGLRSALYVKYTPLSPGPLG